MPSHIDLLLYSCMLSFCFHFRGFIGPIFPALLLFKKSIVALCSISWIGPWLCVCMYVGERWWEGDISWVNYSPKSMIFNSWAGSHKGQTCRCLLLLSQITVVPLLQAAFCKGQWCEVISGSPSHISSWWITESFSCADFSYILTAQGFWQSPPFFCQ